MRLTIEKLKEFQASAKEHRKVLYDRFVKAHEVINNQNVVAVKVISEYNYWGGYEYAMMKIIQLKELKPSQKRL